jgi:excinuclease ABC subunit C
MGVAEISKRKPAENGFTQERIKGKLARLPHSPGVYLLRDNRNRVIYIGKAAALSSRVRSYFHSTQGRGAKLRSLVPKIADFEVIKTATEVEAFILEDTLIKRYQPRFNIRLRDDKRYPYIKITDETFPRVIIVRRRAADGGRYFGPYTNVKAMRATLKLAQRLFPIRTCNLKLPLKEPRRPCLNYYIERCSAPCASLITPAEYAETIERAVMFFEGRTSDLIKKLQTAMHQAAATKRYEQAAKLRDQITALNHTLQRQSLVLPDMADRDAIGIAITETRACAEVFFIRDGRVVDRKTFFLRTPNSPEVSEALSAFLPQYYNEATTVPKEVLLPRELADAEGLARWLSSIRGDRVRIKVPKRGGKRRIVKLAMENASYSLKAERVNDTLRAEANQTLSELAAALSLSSFPERIEAFDISNLQGQQATGSMVVFRGGKPYPNAYRRFKVRLPGTPDDYAMMSEVLRRRFRRGLAELNDPSLSRGRFLPFPDLILIDGGKGQLNAVLSVLEGLNLDGINTIGLAKRHEDVFLPGQSEPVHLPRTSKALLLLRRIRDEAHRFAISYHRRLRHRYTLSSELDRIEGIGPKRRQDLLEHFGSVDKVRHASIEELALLPKIPRSLAKRIHESMHPED